MHLRSVGWHWSGEQKRVDPRFIPAQTPVKMRACRAASRTNRADALTLADGLAKLHVDARQMEESAAEALAVVDDQQIALQREGMIGRQRHHSVSRRQNGIAGDRSDIDAA